MAVSGARHTDGFLCPDASLDSLGKTDQQGEVVELLYM